MRGLTPFQTLGPFFDVFLRSRRPNRQLAEQATNGAIRIEGSLYDGAGVPVVDGLVETWQADARGRYIDGDAHEPLSSVHRYGWCHTDDRGAFSFRTIKPGMVQCPRVGAQASHVLISVMARGILTRYVTRVYFEDETANDTDPILNQVPVERRSTLIASRIGTSAYRFDIRLQGANETVFFHV